MNLATDLTRISRFPCLAGAAALAAFAPAALAQAESPGVPSSALLQMLVGLVIIIAVLFAAAYFLRRFNDGRGFGSSGPMRVVGGLMLSARERIVLVEVADAWLVIGIVPGQIKTLHTLPKGDLPAGQAAEKSFGQWLKQVTERKDERH